MATIINNIFLYDDHAEVEIIHTNYRVNILIDLNNIDKFKKLRLSNKDYVLNSNGELLSRIIMNCEKGNELFVDHINGNKLDNRKINLRVVNQSINERNKHQFSRNNTGIIGIQYRENGLYKYYRVSWRDLDGKRATKQFNINVLGEEIAFFEAKKTLLSKYEEYEYFTHKIK